MDFQKRIKASQSIMIEKLQELLRIRSVYDETTVKEDTPFGKGIAEALQYMLTLGEQDGFAIAKDGGYAGHIAYGSGKEIVGILCHLDVVPEGQNWLYPPYAATIVDDKLYARGTTDDKGPTMACYFALKFIKDAGIKLKKQIRIILGTDEETAWRGIHHYFETYPMPDLGFAPDSSFPLIYGEKGRIAVDIALEDMLSCDYQNDILVSLHGGERYNVVIDHAEAVVKSDLSPAFMQYLNQNHLKGDVYPENENYRYIVEGTAAHAMEPELGINAGTHLCHFLKDYSHNQLVQYIAKYHHLDTTCKHLGVDYRDEEMGPITCNIGIIDIEGQTSRVTLDCRYPVRYDVAKFKATLLQTLRQNGLKQTKLSCKEPHYVAPTDPLVQKLYQAYIKHTKDENNKPFTVGGGTYASMLEKGVAFGMEMPGEVVLAHQPNEYIKISTFLLGVAIYIDAILALGEVDA